MEKIFNDFGYGLFFWLIVILTILIVLLAKFAWKPIMESIETREEGIRSALQAAENAKKEMQELQANNERILNEARAERDTMIKEAREIREKMIAEAKEDAQAQGSRLIEQAKASIESEKNAAMAELKMQVSTLSLQIAEKILKDQLSSNDSQVKLVEKMLDEVKLN
ncbi:F0F1 ATP synthase subunit B [Flavobacterium columnare]|uniref:F0F1 ATP synthase subunit B n=1 Tax=Flavobacterium columnare TaxID=996 RepID=UPI000D1B24F9|nr:F0F1 ATP synthase subunit B [Flavobacterium columnare]PTD13931.1 ATP synthase F0 subunit B [Flavobacterium columnare]